MKKLFADKNKISYIEVIIFAVLVALYTSFCAIFPPFKNTSFNDIAVYIEWWILFAVLIIDRTNSIKEAAIKCFLFFLISQPLIFLFQVPFNNLGFGIFIHYKRWFYITLLTIPGACLCYFIKRRDLFSTIDVGIAICLLSYQFSLYLEMFFNRMPSHLLSMISIIFISFYLIIKYSNTNIQKVILIIIFIFSLIVFININDVFFKSTTKTITIEADDLSYTIDNDIADISIKDNNVIIESFKKGSAVVSIYSNDKLVYSIYLDITNGDIIYSIIEE